MSQPPDDRGPDHRERRRRPSAVGSLAGDAYQGALEAVMAVLVGVGIGYWVDRRWGTTPIGVITGVVIGFAAMVLRLLRMRGALESGAEGAATAPSAQSATPEGDGDRALAEMPAAVDLWRDEPAGRDDAAAGAAKTAEAEAAEEEEATRGRG